MEEDVKTTADATTYRQALILHGKCHDSLRKGVIGGDQSDLYIRSSVVPGIYEHFKSTPESRKYYLVQALAEDVNGAGALIGLDGYWVNYYALYAPNHGKHAKRILVGDDSFLLPINREGYGQVVRFQFIEKLDPMEAFLVHPKVRQYYTA